MANRDRLRGLGELREGAMQWLRAWPRRWRAFFAPAERPKPWSGDARFWWRRVLSVAAAAWLLIFVFESALRKLDPFGLNYAAGLHSAELGARSLAPFYESEAQSQVAVVLIDEATLRARGLSWPPPYAYHEEVLRRILRGRPRAVYVDLLMTDRRGDAATLDATRSALAADIAAAGIPVFYARALPDADYLFDGVPGIAFPLAGWQKSPGSYPLSVAPHQQVGAQMAEQACIADAAHRSVALALYDASCGVGAGGRLPVGCAEPASALRDRCAAMWVQWGIRAPPRFDGVAGVEGCDRLERQGTWKALRRMVWRDLWSGFDPAGFQEARVRCPFTMTIAEQDLNRDTIGQLRDKVVLVGANLIGLDDSVETPVHGRLPGVYLHAMAVDNLMSRGSAHPKPPFDEFLTSLIVGAIAALLLALVLKAGWSHAVTFAALCVLAGCIALLPAWVMWAVWQRAPPNWIAVVAIFALVAFGARKRMAAGGE